MNFGEAQAQLERLEDLRQQGRISPEQYLAELNKLQVLDESGVWWQPHPHGQGWLKWDGVQWQEATPPQLAGATSSAATPGGHPLPEPAPAKTQFLEVLQSYWQRLQARLIDPKSFAEISQGVPWSQRPQPWWDALSIAGGAASGYLWFVYGSVRGMPRLSFWGLGRESWLDFVPALILLIIPLLVFLCRTSVLNALQPFRNRFQHLGVGVKLALGGGLLLVFGLLSTNNPIFRQREGLDFLTPILMTAIPVLLVWFRQETDRLLIPIQPIRQAIPKPVLIGIGLMIPFLTAYIIYNIFGIIQYPLLRTNVVVGTLLSYVILRTPGQSAQSPPWSPGYLTWLLLAGIFLLLINPVLADDFLRDPFNLNDGLRTDGIAPILAGVSTAVVSILVNGVEVAKVIIQDTKPVEEGEEAVHKKFVVVVNTVDKSGAISTTLEQMANDTIFAYAHCEEIGKGRFPAGDDTIVFSLTSAEQWVFLKDLNKQHGERCARLTFASPLPTGTPPETATLMVSAGTGDLISAEVTISLVLGGFVLEVF